MYDTSQFLREVFQGAEMDYIYILELGTAGKKQRFLTIEQALEYCENTPSQVHVYYGVYARHSHSGKAKAATTTGALWADYDGMDMPTVMERIGAAGLPKPSVVVSSGHGWHCYWLLTERVGRQALRVVKALAIATGADSKATDRARVMRLPGSMNVKGESVPCRVIEANWARYELTAIMTALGIADEPAETGEPAEENDGEPGRFIAEIRRSPMACVKALAVGVPEGHRNAMLGRVTKDLQRRGFTKDKAWGVVVRWNRLNKPPESMDKLRGDFEAYWHGDYKLLGCVHNNPDLQAILACYCASGECFWKVRGVTSDFQFDQMVTFNNRALNNLRGYTGRDLIILGLLTDYKQGLSRAQLVKRLASSVTGKPCMGRIAMDTSLEKLRRDGWIQLIDRNRQAGQDRFYKAIPQGTYGTGFTLVSNAAIDRTIDGAVSPGAFRVYVLLMRYAFGKGTAFPSLHAMGKELGINAHAVSAQITCLENAGFLERIKGCYQNNPDKLVYRFRI